MAHLAGAFGRGNRVKKDPVTYTVPSEVVVPPTGSVATLPVGTAGALCYDASLNRPFYSNGQAWTEFGDQLENTGIGAPLITPDQTEIKGLAAGANVTLVDTGTSVIINSASSSSQIVGTCTTTSTAPVLLANIPLPVSSGNMIETTVVVYNTTTGRADGIQDSVCVSVSGLGAVTLEFGVDRVIFGSDGVDLSYTTSPGVLTLNAMGAAGVTMDWKSVTTVTGQT